MGYEKVVVSRQMPRKELLIMLSIPSISGKDFLAEQPNISKKELEGCIKLSKKNKILGYTATGMNSASSAIMLSTGRTSSLIAGGLLAIVALISLYTSLAMGKVNNAAKEAYKIKYNA